MDQVWKLEAKHGSLLALMDQVWKLEAARLHIDGISGREGRLSLARVCFGGRNARFIENNLPGLQLSSVDHLTQAQPQLAQFLLQEEH